MGSTGVLRLSGENINLDNNLSRGLIQNLEHIICMVPLFQTRHEEAISGNDEVKTWSIYT